MPTPHSICSGLTSLQSWTTRDLGQGPQLDLTCGPDSHWLWLLLMTGNTSHSPPYLPPLPPVESLDPSSRTNPDITSPSPCPGESCECPQSSVPEGLYQQWCLWISSPSVMAAASSPSANHIPSQTRTGQGALPMRQCLF